MRAFNPTTWNAKRNAVRALAKTNMEIYPSRTEVQMVHYNVSLLNFLYQSYQFVLCSAREQSTNFGSSTKILYQLPNGTNFASFGNLIFFLFCQGKTVIDFYMSNEDIYQLFIEHNVKGVRREAGRCFLGVNMGDAGVMNEVVQARFNPSAGQRALQAGEEEDAQQAEPQAFEPQAENLFARRDAEPQAPPNAEQEALAIEDIQNGEPGGPADMRRPAEMPAQLAVLDREQALRDVEQDTKILEGKIGMKRKVHGWVLEQSSWQKDVEMRAACEWRLEMERKQLEVQKDKFQQRMAERKQELEQRMAERKQELEQRMAEEEWEIEKKEKTAASNKKIKEHEAA
jgi:hypothetical protein